MAGCVPCFIIPLLLFIFHRYIQPIVLKFWNPWEKVEANKEAKGPFQCLSCNKDNKNDCSNETETAGGDKLKMN